MTWHPFHSTVMPNTPSQPPVPCTWWTSSLSTYNSLMNCTASSCTDCWSISCGVKWTRWGPSSIGFGQLTPSTVPCSQSRNQCVLKHLRSVSDTSFPRISMETTLTSRCTILILYKAGTTRWKSSSPRRRLGLRGQHTIRLSVDSPPWRSSPSVREHWEDVERQIPSSHSGELWLYLMQTGFLTKIQCGLGWSSNPHWSVLCGKLASWWFHESKRGYTWGEGTIFPSPSRSKNVSRWPLFWPFYR